MEQNSDTNNAVAAAAAVAGTKRKHTSDDDQSPVPDASASSATSGTDNSPQPPLTAKGKPRKTKQKNFSKLGRRGDPRMHKAVAARLVNVDMPLIKALLVGGFTFPLLDDEGNPKDPNEAKIDDAKVMDAEGVSLAQRKNQLSRRIRIAREKIQEDGGDMSAYTDVLEGTPFAFKRQKVSNKASATSEAELKALLRTSEAKKQVDILMKERPDAMEFAAIGNENGAAIGNDLGQTASLHQTHAGQYPFLPTHQQPPSSMVAGLPDSAPEVLIEDPDDDMISPANSGANYRRAKDHPMFAQYQASLTGGFTHQWGGHGNVMTSVAAKHKQATATAGLAALGAVAHAHSAATGAVDDSKSSKSAKTDSLSLAAASMGMSPEMISMIIGQGTKVTSASTQEKKEGGNVIPEDEDDKTDMISDSSSHTCSAAADNEAEKVASNSSDSAAAAVHVDREVDPEQEAAIDEAKLKIALNVYQTEHSTLLKRCLMVAGFDPSRSEECDPLYIQFAERCAQAEHRRLHRLTLCFQGRHVHRLDGRCGHKAVLHHPAGDPHPHVDFIVNGKVECFRNAGGIKSADGNEALWPSKFSCDDAGCSDHSDCHHGEKGEMDCHKKSHADVTCGKGKCDKKCDAATKQMGDPSILYLSEKDIEGHDEWKCMSEIDIGSVMDGLLDDSALGLQALTADPPSRSRSRSCTITDDQKPAAGGGGI